jgi:wyosine [tRNA(Phe)-imidazoG37] synthetase (radical SAM superfamily)
VPENVFLDALQKRIFALQTCDCLTFAGTGEPTLDSRLGSFITKARMIAKQTPIKIITNSSQLMHIHVIRNLSKADEVIAKLNTVSAPIFTAIHRPFDTTLNPTSIIEGLQTLKQIIGRKLTIEILFISSRYPLLTNTTADEITKLSATLRQLAPGQVQLHTIKRTPAESYALPVKRSFLAAVASALKKTLTTTKVITSF